ncbi:hypothetical protein Q7P36_002539 [Cladosporium allicinum]
MRRHCGYHLESAAEPKPAVARLSHVKPFHGFSHVPVISGGSRRVGESAAPQNLQHVKACVVRPDQISPATVCGGVGGLSCWCAALIHTRKRNPADTSFFCADGFVGERLRWGHEGVRTGVETPNDPLPETNGLESRSEVSPRQGVGQRRRERMTRDTRMRREGSEMDLCTRATRLSCAHGKPSRLGASAKARCAVSREQRSLLIAKLLFEHAETFLSILGYLRLGSSPQIIVWKRAAGGRRVKEDEDAGPKWAIVADTDAALGKSTTRSARNRTGGITSVGTCLWVIPGTGTQQLWLSSGRWWLAAELAPPHAWGFQKVFPPRSRPALSTATDTRQHSIATSTPAETVRDPMWRRRCGLGMAVGT